MDSKSDTLKKLEALYNQARTPAERAILLGTMCIVSPEEYARLEEVLQREQLRNMPMEEILPTLAQQRGVSIEKTRRAVADLMFDHMLDRSKLPLTGVSHSGALRDRASTAGGDAQPGSSGSGRSEDCPSASDPASAGAASGCFGAQSANSGYRAQRGSTPATTSASSAARRDNGNGTGSAHHFYTAAWNLCGVVRQTSNRKAPRPEERNNYEKAQLRARRDRRDRIRRQNRAAPVDREAARPLQKFQPRGNPVERRLRGKEVKQACASDARGAS